MLGAVTALLVARPLLPGEDPGHTAPLTGAAGPVLTSLWLLGVVGWAVWRAWAARTVWRSGGVEKALVVFGLLLMVAAAFAAAYKHAAWLAVGEWAGVVAAFWLVRQLPESAEENRALLTALLATAVCVALQGIVQLFVPPAVPVVDPIVAAIHDWQPPAAVTGAAAAPFAQPASFATYLTLLVPALLVGLYLAARSSERWTPRLVLIAGCAALVLLALGLARWWPAVLALLAVNACFLLIARTHLPAQSVRLGVAATLGAALLLLVLAWGDVRTLLAGLVAQTTPVTALVGDHFFLGVGPGNFSRHYPAYLASPAAERLPVVGNLLLETMALGGMLTLAALLVLLVALGRRVLPELALDWHLTRGDEAEDIAADGGERPLRWEVMIGGVLGLALTFLLAAGNSRREIVELGVISVVRSLVWLGAFVVLEGIPWTARWRVVALAAGVLAMLLTLLAAPGFFYASLAIPLWSAVALLLNALPAPAGVRAGGKLSLLVPVPVLLTLWWVYFLFLFLPVTTAAQSVRLARAAYGPWRERAEPKWQQAVADQANATAAALGANDYLQKFILKPLGEAVQTDPNDADLRVEYAWWLGKGWALFAPLKPNAISTRDEQARAHFTASYSNAALNEQLQPAQELDPFGTAGYRALAELRQKFPELPTMRPSERHDNFQMAANWYATLARLDPSDPRYRYGLANTLRRTEEAKNADLWRQEAERAQQLNREATGTRRQLTSAQVADLKSWLAEKN